VSASPTIPLRNALVAVIKAGATILQGRMVYLEGSDALRGAALPYVILGTGTETPEGVSRYNGQEAHESTVQLKCWGNDKHQAEQAYEELKAKVDNVALTIAGHGIGRGRLSKLADLPEPNPEVGGHQVVARLRLITQVVA
jgi:hypothetical protein